MKCWMKILQKCCCGYKKQSILAAGRKTMEIRIIFVFQVASFWPSWESVYLSCMEDEDFRVKVMWIEDTSGDAAQMDSAESFLTDRNIPYERFCYESVMEFAPHYMVYQTPYDKGHRPPAAWSGRFQRQGIRIVYLPYGIEISDTKESRYKHFSLPVVLNAFRIYVLSPAMEKEYRKYCVNAKAVRATGLPRFDRLKEKEQFPLSRELRRRTGSRKIILWKVHFPKVFLENGIKKQATPRLEEYLDFADYIRRQKELFFIFMPHPKFADDTVDESLLSGAKELLRKLKEMENVYIDRSDEYRNSLLNADAVMTDRSAVMAEAGAVGVPVMYLYNGEYYEPMTEPVQNLLAGYESGTRASDMEGFCSRCLKGEDLRKREREEAFQMCVPFFDGRCAERIRQDLRDGLSEKMERAERLSDGSRTFLFGTGYIGEICMDAWEQRADGQKPEIRILAFLDNDREKQGKGFRGIPILSPGEIQKQDYDYIVIASDSHFREIYLQLTQAMGVPEKKILGYDQFILACSFDDLKIRRLR